MSKQTYNITQSEIVDYLMGIIEHGTEWALLELYNSVTNYDGDETTAVQLDEVDWDN